MFIRCHTHAGVFYEVACYNMNKWITPKTANIHTKLKDAVREWNKRWRNEFEG